MNTRLQVEHPVTEWVTGVDLVREMVRVAAGERLGFTQPAIERRGASLECRIYAEDPDSGFLPSPGTIATVTSPSGPGVRDDSSAYPGAVVSSFYDPLISKLSVWGADRTIALARMRRALDEYRIAGVRTNLAFHQRLVRHAEFAAGRYDTGFLGEHEKELVGGAVEVAHASELAAALAVATAMREAAHDRKAERDASSAAGLSPWVAWHRARRQGNS
jgi:acetyl-CoA carboxylase biotin carboxylase subunit